MSISFWTIRVPRGECYRHALHCNGSAANLFSQTTENNYKMLEFFLSIRFIYARTGGGRLQMYFNCLKFRCAARSRPNVTWFQCVFMFDFPLGFHSSDHCKWPLCGFQLWRQANLNFAHVNVFVYCWIYSSRIHSFGNTFCSFSYLSCCQRCYLLLFRLFHRCGSGSSNNFWIML